jgi:hypothetical protein
VSEVKYRIQRERDFKPHHILIGAAKIALENAEAKNPGYLYHELIALTFSALALEAITNSFGERLVLRWEHYKSSSPIAKLRVICSQLKIHPDFNKEPWTTIEWLMRFRNKVAHAKPESIKFDETMSKEEFERIRFEFPNSKLEMQISLENASRSLSSIDQILDQFYLKLNSDDRYYLYSDGFSGNTSTC